MKKLALFIIAFISMLQLQAQNGVAISNSSGATPDASAILDVQSTTQGMLVPRMTEAQKNGISSPATGLMIYQTDGTPGFYHYDGSNWLTSSGAKSLNDLSDAIADFTYLYLGHNAGLSASTSNSYNVGVGSYALYSTTGGDNTAIGYLSGRNLSTGIRNVFVGKDAGYNSTSADHNVFVGKGAGYDNTDGDINIAIGSGVNLSSASAVRELNIGNAIYGTNILPASGDAHIGINTQTPDASASLDISSTTSGLLIPRMTQSDRGAITTPATALLIYQTDNTPGFYYFDGSIWATLGGAKSINDLSDGETGSHSVFLGIRPLGNGTINSDNTGIGYASMDFLTSGTDNIAIGYMSGGFLDAGSHNIMVGTNCAPSASTANSELNIGKAIFGTNIYPAAGTSPHIGINTQSPDAAAALDIVSSNTGLLIPRVDITDLSTPAPMSTVVTSLLAYNTNTTTGPGFFYWDGSAWVSATGAKKLDDLSDAKSDGFYDIYIGKHAGEVAPSNSTSRSIGIGAYALQNATGVWNTAVGRTAGRYLTTGQHNVFLGKASGYHASSINNSTFVGSGSGYNVSTGTDNTFMGADAGNTTTTGSSNILIGYGVVGTSASASNEMNIGSAIYATGLYGPSAKVGIGNGTNAPAATLDVSGDVKVATSINIGTAIHLTPGSAPASPTEGDMYMNSSTHKLMVYDGTTWQACW